jgi:hypothetical protein
MFDNKTLTLRLMKQKQCNQFCPRCGGIIPPETKCISSPTHGDVQYHPSCFYALAANIGCRIQYA